MSERSLEALRNLISALPKCGAITGWKVDAHGEAGDEIECARPATKQGEIADAVYCDTCGPLCEDWRVQPDLPYAPALRVALAIFERGSSWV